MVPQQAAAALLLYLVVPQLLEEFRKAAVLERLAPGLASRTVEDVVVREGHARDGSPAAGTFRSGVIVDAVVLARLFLRQLPRHALAQLLRLRGDDREQRQVERTRLRLRERSGEPHGREPRLVEDLVGQSVSDPRDRALIREERLELAGLRFHGAPEPLVRQLASRGIRTEAPELQHVRGILGEPEPRPLFLSMLDQIEA